MNILAFDTSMAACSATVLRYQGEDRVCLGSDAVARSVSFEDATARCDMLASEYEEMTRGHAEKLMPMISHVMQASGLSFSELDRIAVTLGPGTFTGVRIGVAAARGLALASGKETVSLTSLHVIALTWLAQHPNLVKSLGQHKKLAVVGDARRGAVYVQHFSFDGAAMDQAQLISVEAATAMMQDKVEECLVIGSGAGLVLPSLVSDGESYLPNALHLAVMAGSLCVSFSKISPLYLRAADAKVQSGNSLKRQ